MNQKNKRSEPQKKLRLTGFNRLFLHLFLIPVFTMLYYPVNRYVVLPKLGSGAPYTDMNGQIVERYFSANSLARVILWILIALTFFFTIRRAKLVHGWRKAVYFLFCFLGCLTASILYLEFTLWTSVF